ncbi:hypothetical protein DL766_005644 [Monosporascus sp. MC13-8B]|uniref:Vps72/YL1 C-terminal domain-containing protein n=1 Tax=Monosporascus cannonballus TaxID=155416 RepID=A0ABY0H5P1_9PEZI|nr:hypothetical protein DL762_005538 [Monosporascus cannonballus]RYO89519.1 hypothetical protein DL763_005619 [Monosporascus cannonballus]RYP28866.1 hypothetical protein DL766_005644 [Monosporascus sp. MC13-8B]
MSKAPSKAPSRAPGAPPAASSPSQAPPPSRAPVPAHPSASTGSRGPGEVVSLTPSKAPKAVSPSSQPPIAASAAPLPSKAQLRSHAPTSAHPSKYPSSRAPGQLTPVTEVTSSPSKVPLPYSVPAAAPLTSNVPLPSPAPTSARPPTISPRSRAPSPPQRPSAVPAPAAPPSPAPSAHAVSGSAGPASATPAAVPSAPPGGNPSIVSAYRDVEDRRRAVLQTAYATLAPGERAAQDAWATRKADELAPCPYNFPWLRDDECPGYRCAGGAHYVSDTILAEGVPGLYATRCHPGLRNWDREPTEQEQVPPGYYGPVRPVGVDKRGRYTYFEKGVDWEKTSLRKQIEPTAFDWS